MPHLNHVKPINNPRKQNQWLAQVAGWAADLLKTTILLFIFESLQRVKATSSGLPTEEEEGRVVLSIEVEAGSLACQIFKEALCGWSWGLIDWWVIPPHCVVMAPLCIVSNVFLSIKTISFQVLLHYTSNLCPKLTFPRILNKSVLFSLFAGTEEVEGGSRTEEVCSMPGARGTPGAGDGFSGYPC